MPIYACDDCGMIENTATANYWFRKKGDKKLCSQCDPKIGKWHGAFKRHKPTAEQLKNMDGDFFRPGEPND